MAITQNLSDINTIIYKGNDCKIVHFGDACTWAKKYTLTVPSAAIQNTATYGKTITVSRTSKQATLSSTGTIGTISATGNTIFASTWNPTTFTVYHGDIIEVTTNSGSYEAEYSSYSITGDTAVNIVKVGSTPTPTTVSFTVNKTSYTVSQGTTWNTWANSTSGFTVEYDYILSPDGSPICTSSSTIYSWTFISPSSTISAGDYYTVNGLNDYNITGGSSGGGTTPSNPGTGGGGNTGGTNITFTMDGISFTCPSGTKWSTLESSVLGYGIYEDGSNGWATPVGSGGPPWVIDSAGDPVEYTATIKSGGSYHIGTPSS